MTSFRHALFALPLCALVLMGAGCFGGSSASTGFDGGVFRTVDAGTKWDQLKILNLDTKLGSTADMGIVSVAFDPQDPQAMYVGTVENGVMQSLNGGQSWTLARGLSKGQINAIAVDPKDTCSVYAARGNQIHKTSNCGREWKEIYPHPRPDVLITSVVVDWYNNHTVYAATSQGDVLRSDDAGGSWRAVYRIESVRINSIAIDPFDSRTLYVATQGSGIVKTTDSGATWTQIYKQLQEFQYARSPRQVVLDPTVKDRVYQISKYGILRSDDGGTTWRALNLPTAPSTVDIKSLTVHPKDGKIIAYATDSSLVVSDDTGVSWSSKKLPTKRGVSWIAFDRETTPALFLGALPKK